MNSIVDFKEHFPHGNNDRPVSETHHHELKWRSLFSFKIKKSRYFEIIRHEFTGVKGSCHSYHAKFSK